MDSGCLSPQFEKLQVVSYLLTSILAPCACPSCQGSLPNELDNDEEIIASTKVCVDSQCALNQLMINQVPEVEDFSQDTQILTGIIDDLKTKWNCAVDGPCYVTSNGQHVPLTKFRLSGWASEIVSGHLPDLQILCQLSVAESWPRWG